MFINILTMGGGILIDKKAAGDRIFQAPAAISPLMSSQGGNVRNRHIPY